MPISPEQFDQNTKGQDPETPEMKKQRTIEDAKALQEGAEYTDSGRLEFTEEQVDVAAKEMEMTQFREKLKEIFNDGEIRTLIEALNEKAQRDRQSISDSDYDPRMEPIKTTALWEIEHFIQSLANKLKKAMSDN